jgi:Putative DNA-binding domain
MKSPFHYVLKTKLIETDSDGKPIFINSEKVFENESPIIAREEAFDYLQNYIDVLLQGLGSKYVSDKQARRALKKHRSFVSIGIHFIQTTKSGEMRLASEDSNCVYAIGPIGAYDMEMDGDSASWGDEYFLDAIKYEIRLYSYFKCDMEEYVVEIPYYFDDDIDPNDPESNIQWYPILRTQFDWNAYCEESRLRAEAEFASDPDYNNPPDEPETESSEDWFKEQISKGECETTEFKPALAYNFKTEKGGIGIKGINARAICAFLNSHGGVLFIGISDKGEILGLDSDFSLAPKDENPQDYVRLEFDQMITHFFGRSMYSNIVCTMLTIDEKNIFAIRVWPSLNGPVFINGRDANGKDRKEFYIRGAASSLPLHDTLDELVGYCLRKWGSSE